MSLETDLVAVLKTVCPRVFPDVAPANTAKPYVTWQALGGQSLRYLDSTAADKRNVLMQVNVWSATRLEALSIASQVEDAMCASAQLTVDPEGGPMSTYEADTGLYGTIQRFSIYGNR